MVKTATNQNGDTAKHDTKMATNQNGDTAIRRPEWRQTETATSQNGNKAI